MRPNEAESPDAKPRLHVVGFGGTIMSVPHQHPERDEIILKPRPDSLPKLVSLMSGKVRDRLHDRLDQTAMHDMYDSADALAVKHVADIVEVMRRKIRESESADVFIVLYGTDTMPDLITALGNGIPAKELGRKAIIATCSMEHLEAPQTDAYKNFERAALLASMPEIRGKIGLCIGGKEFVPPRGVEKVVAGKRESFFSRFMPMATFLHRKDKWNFIRKTEPYDLPRGGLQEGEDYRLTQGVECIDLTSTSNYKYLRRLLQNKGTVIRAPGNGNLRTDPYSRRILDEAAKSSAGPVIIVGQAMQKSGRQGEVVDEVYEGDASLYVQSRLMHGGVMTSSEARMFLSHHLAEAKRKKLKFGEMIDFIHSQLTIYPFRTAKGSTWQPIEKEEEE